MTAPPFPVAPGGAVACDYPIVQANNTDFLLAMNWLDATGTPINLTGHHMRMQLRRTADEADPPVLDLSDGSGAIALGGSPYNIRITVLAATWATLTPRAYTYDLIDTDAAGHTTPLIGGSFGLVAGTTRA